MKIIKNLVHILTFFALISYASISLCGTLEDIQNQLKGPDSPKKTKTNSIYDIQDIYKSKVSGWVWDKGTGTKTLLAINVKFKIKQKGEKIKIPYLCVYLFDREKNITKKINKYFFLSTAGAIQKSDNDYFRGNQTYQLQFPYDIEDKFHYIIAIIGDDNNCSYSVLPKGTSLDEFEFSEKYLIR